MPLRRLYEAAAVEPLRALQSERVAQAREVYRCRRGEIAESGLSIEDPLEAGRQALSDMQTAVTTAYRELRPRPFGEWLQEREERRNGPVRPLVGEQSKSRRSIASSESDL